MRIQCQSQAAEIPANAGISAWQIPIVSELLFQSLARISNYKAN
jgi:hypothetical protein